MFKRFYFSLSKDAEPFESLSRHTFLVNNKLWQNVQLKSRWRQHQPYTSLTFVERLFPRLASASQTQTNTPFMYLFMPLLSHQTFPNISVAFLLEPGCALRTVRPRASAALAVVRRLPGSVSVGLHQAENVLVKQAALKCLRCFLLILVIHSVCLTYQIPFVGNK